MSRRKKNSTPPPPSRDELLASCGDLALEGDILRRVAADAQRAGFAGPTTALELTYLAITSRALTKPVSVGLRGPSSGGKSFTIKHALAFHPDEAAVVMTAMSEKAIVYLDEDLRHKVLVVQEGTGVTAGFSAYAVRSLLSEGRLEYIYADFEHRTTRRITREGPTGLVMSTAGRIDYELATRLITPSVEDTPELTAAILSAEAREAQGHEVTPDYAPYHALQRLIASGRCDVVVPFADRIAERTDHKAVRMRRDFGAVMGLTKASALLHQQTRPGDSDGRIVAIPADYALVHGLVAGMVAETAGKTVPRPVRETVETVSELELSAAGGLHSVTIKQVAEALDITRTSASRRLSRAEALGYVRDATGSTRGPKGFHTAEPMPGDAPVLPDPEAIA